MGFCYCTIYIPLLLTKKGQGHSVLQHCFHILERERDFTFHKIYSMAMSASIHLVYEAGKNTTTIYFMHYTLSMAKVQWALNKTKKTHKIRRGDSAQLGNTSKSVVPDNSTSNSDCRITEKNGKKTKTQIK